MRSLAHLGVAVAAVIAGASGCALLSLDALRADPGGADASDGSASIEAGDAGADAPTCDADLQADPANCGACGHDCCGGSCAAGACVPRVLASAQAQPSFVYVARDWVYWTTGPTQPTSPVDVWRVRTDGTSLERIATQRRLVYGIRVDSRNVYWMEFITSPPPVGFFLGMFAHGTPSTDAGVPVVRYSAFDPSATTAFAVGIEPDEDELFWFGASNVDCPGLTRCLFRSPSLQLPDAGFVRTRIAQANNQGFDQGFVHDETYLYGWQSGVVRRMAKVGDGGVANVQTIATATEPYYVGVNSKDVFWSDATLATIYRSSKAPQPDGGPNVGEVFATLQNVPTLLEVDEKDVYWANADGIVTCPVTGCPNGPDKPQLLVADKGIVSFNVSDKCFYWANGASASIKVTGR